MPEVATFLDHLRRSGLIESQVLDDALTRIDRELASRSSDVPIDRFAFISQSLIARYLLTAWQARQLMKGRYKGFFLRQYKILGHLGTGGMSTVYLAEHTLMQRRVAIKVLPRKRLEKSIYLQRFIREAQAIATLDHPNIVRAYDIDREGDVHYIVMEYFDGTNLQRLVEQGEKLTCDQIVRILLQAAEALAHAHEIGVVHRDIKPGNLLVDKNGTVKLLDLGLALLDERMFEGRISSIQEDTILGTADYLAPEQAIDSHKVDARADIYGLGGVLYFCLTGHPPFPEGSVSKRLLAHQQKDPPSVLIDRPDAPADLVAICAKMMSKNPKRRHQSAREVADDLRHWIQRHGYADGLLNDAESPDVTEASTAGPEGEEPVLIAGRDKLMSLIRQMEDGARDDDAKSAHESDFSVLGGEVNVNLFDSGASSGIAARGTDTSTERRIFEDIRRKARREAGIEEDPILFALDEIEETRRRARRAATGREPLPPAEPLIAAQKPAAPTASAHEEPPPATPQPPGPAWYRLVPFWFWSLFAAAVFAAIFLAGVLAALLTFLGERTP